MALNRKGFTGIVDAIFFVLLIGIATAVVADAFSADETVPESDASGICGEIFRAKVTGEDFGMDTGDGIAHQLVDLVAVSLKTGDGSASRYIGNILSDLSPRPDSYLMIISFEGHTETIGSKGDFETGGFSTDYTSRFGPVHVSLTLY